MLRKTITREGKHIEKEIDGCIEKIDFLLRQLTTKEREILRKIENVKVENSNTYQIEISQKVMEPESTVNISESDHYDFQRILDNDEDLLLESHSIHYHPSYLQPLISLTPLEIQVEMRSGWIKRYLDEGDCSLWLESQDGPIEIMGIENGVLSCLTSQNQYIKIKSTDIYQWSQVAVKFDKHKEGFKIQMIVDQQSQVYSIEVEENTRIIVKSQNKSQQIQRLILFKETPEMDLKYQIVWGNYFDNLLLEDIQLDKGKYILLSLGSSSIKEISIFAIDSKLLTFKVAAETNYKTRCILLNSFSEVGTNSNIHSDRQIRQEFSRSVYMNIGIVLQIYQNIYLNQVLFEDEQPVQQDLCLLFRDLYTRHQLENRLRRGEKMIKFFSIEAKPACLFVPQKRVITGSQVMENYKSHSVFK